MTPHILDDGEHLTQRKPGRCLDPLEAFPIGAIGGALLVRPDEGNMFFWAKVWSPHLKERFLARWYAATFARAFS